MLSINSSRRSRSDSLKGRGFLLRRVVSMSMFAIASLGDGWSRGRGRSEQLQGQCVRRWRSCERQEAVSVAEPLIRNVSQEAAESRRGHGAGVGSRQDALSDAPVMIFAAERGKQNWRKWCLARGSRKQQRAMRLTRVESDCSFDECKGCDGEVRHHDGFEVG